MAINDPSSITIGVLALQGAFNEHIQLLRTASQTLASPSIKWSFIEVRNESELNSCDALIIPGGESTAISLVAQRSNLLEPLRDFVKVHRKPTWGTCAGLILLSESANRTKKGGQELIGGLDVRVNRNHFGRQIESFQAELELPFLKLEAQEERPYEAIFIRAPVVERILETREGEQRGELEGEGNGESESGRVVAPSKEVAREVRGEVAGEVKKGVEIMGRLKGKGAAVKGEGMEGTGNGEAGDIVAVRQANVFGTSFHPELTGDARIHVWWLQQVVEAVEKRRQS
ncbi:pyridoxal 5 -phosphate glutaminase subunit Pdx2 protein [Rutstroemia sp. NJR-2017a WRK4]|nr:pyridoxal 5 -phosphate glutaminase subunit Pdx2 protein [Rutstroemia sp. NJR-2017a WRK4]